jgi:hypothetical protein
MHSDSAKKESSRTEGATVTVQMSKVEVLVSSIAPAYPLRKTRKRENTQKRLIFPLVCFCTYLRVFRRSFSYIYIVVDITQAKNKQNRLMKLFSLKECFFFLFKDVAKKGRLRKDFFCFCKKEKKRD